MKKSFLILAIVLSLMVSGSAAFADDLKDVMDPAQEGKVVQQMLQLTPENLKRAAIIACIQRGWSIVNVSDDKITAVYKNSKVEVTIANDTVTAEIVNGGGKKRWVQGLTRDTFVALLHISR